MGPKTYLGINLIKYSIFKRCPQSRSRGKLPKKIPKQCKTDRNRRQKESVRSRDDGERRRKSVLHPFLP